MAIQYPGGTIVNTTFTGATKNNIVTNLQTQLNNAGWTTISGGGTGDVILESATTPTASNNIRVRLRDSAATNCAVINMQNAAATQVSQNCFLLPAAAKTFRVIANKYQFFCFTPGTSAAREFLGCGVPWIPSFLHGVVTGELGWINGNASSDTSTTVLVSLRTALETHGGTVGSNSASYFSGLVNGSMVNISTLGLNGLGSMRLVIPYSAAVQAFAYGFRWHDDSLMISDPLIAWGLTSGTSDEAKIRGQLWGAMVVSDAFAGDTALSSVDGHDWWAITNANAGTTGSAKGTLFLATN